ncbi:copine-1 [Platysternon megacephalum]|uniref:Copine-1 n=1 Tax=Platysternon megacephalum TaxID=55544 RepID=A0A4D9EHV5_9SAUR|nr:copine-1 [Platysternon megacephalum]
MERRQPPPPSFPRGWTVLVAVLGLMLPGRQGAAGYYPRFSPFFFLCTHHGELAGDGEQGEVLMSLQLAGNPTFYVPGQEYHGQEYFALV